jgi:hypothetical protein
MIVEKWAYKSTDDTQVAHKGKPLAKERRTDPAMLDFMNTSMCRWKFLAEYNGDTTAEGERDYSLRRALTLAAQLSNTTAHFVVTSILIRL